MTSTVTCYTCHQPALQADTQSIHLLTPTDRRRNGYEILSTNQLVHECNDCFAASTDEDTHIYTVSSCGILRTVGAATPQEAAALLMQAHGWRSTRSVAVQAGNVWCEYLDCQILNGALQFSEQVDLA